MKTSKNPFLVKVSYDEKSSKTHFNRKQSLQIDRGSRQSLDRQIKENYLSSYPVFETTKSKILSPLLSEENCEQYELERKKSSFLKNYNEKLKRQRKRQLKLKSSIKQIKLSTTLNQTRTINYNQELQNYANVKVPISFKDQEKRTSSILVLRKTPFLDTSSSIFRQRKDYSKDSSLQLLLKEINDIKMEEKKQIQRLNQQNKNLQKESQSKNINHGTLENFLTKYDRGFLLPMKRKAFLRNETFFKASNDVQTAQNSFSKYTSKDKFPPHKKMIERGKLQKFYNFKQIDPWQNPSQRQQNQSFENHFLFSTLQHSG